MHCRNCKTRIRKSFLKFKDFPLANNLKNKLSDHEERFDLKIYFCEVCFLVQANEVVVPKSIFTNQYPYQSSTSTKFLSHCEKYSNQIINEYNLNKKSFVIEVACNDGYMLNFFKKKLIPHLGIEPTNTAHIAKNKGINVTKKFFNLTLAKNLLKRNIQADCLIGNNVLAHVPDILNFLEGVKIILKKNGVAIFEFPHLLQLIKKNLFDTFYHEHYHYFSAISLSKIVRSSGLKIFKIKKTNIHGGSLRIFISHENSIYRVSSTVKKTIDEELGHKLNSLKTFEIFSKKLIVYKSNVQNLLKKLKSKKIVGYGAAAKASVLINYLKLSHKNIMHVYDKSKTKHDKYIPGTNIQIRDTRNLKNDEFDYLIIFPWNLSEEIKNDLKKLTNKKFKVVTLIPDFAVINF